MERGFANDGGCKVGGGRVSVPETSSMRITA